MYDDLEILRLRRSLPRPTPAPAGPGGSAAFVGVVTTASPAVGTFCLVTPVVLIGGAEAEGGAATLEADESAAAVPVYLLGPAAPATGDALVCRFVDYRWVAERTTGTAGCAGASLRVVILGCAGGDAPHQYPADIGGFTVTVSRGGVVVGTATAAAAGAAIVSLPGAGTYDVDVSAPGFVAPPTRTVVCACAVNGISYTLAMDSDNYVCCCDCGAGFFAQRQFFVGGNPVPRTLYLTDANVTNLPLVYDPAARVNPNPFNAQGVNPPFFDGSGTWRGGYSYTAPGSTADAYGNCTGAATVAVTIQYTLWCPWYGDTWWLQQEHPYCGTDRAGIASGSPLTAGALGFRGGDTTPPVLLSFDLEPGILAAPYDSAGEQFPVPSGTVTVSQ
jgi:hypothetical protein